MRKHRNNLTLLFTFLCYSSFIKGQVKVPVGDAFSRAKSLVVSIGFVANGKFLSDGSEICTYVVGPNAQIYNCVITAKHVLNDFLKRHLNLYLRPSWADSIKITEYFGTKIDLISDVRKEVDYFVPYDTTEDIACILFKDNEDLVASDYYQKRGAQNIFPYNDIKDAQLGQNIYIYGYPSHVENPFIRINYSVCTLKTGIVSWVPNYITGDEMDKFILVESNASYGNSGGPVFNTDGKLIGIVIGSFRDDPETVFVKGQEVPDSLKNQLIIEGRSGVCTILKAEIIKHFIEEVEGRMKRGEN